MPARTLWRAMYRDRRPMPIASATRSTRSTRTTASAVSEERVAPPDPIAMSTSASARADASLMPSPTMTTARRSRTVRNGSHSDSTRSGSPTHGSSNCSISAVLMGWRPRFPQATAPHETTTRDARGMPTTSVASRGQKPANTSSHYRAARRSPADSAGRPACGDYRRCPASCRNLGSVRARDVRGMERSRRSTPPRSATKHAYLQVLYGSDGTRTRDLRRDRPVLALAG